jgi:methylglutaconyl-CoA hydratase
VHEAVANRKQLDAKIAELASALLQGGPKALAASKALIRAVAHRPIADGVVEDTAQRIAALRATPEAKEGLAAFLEKRQPAWMAGVAGER